MSSNQYIPVLIIVALTVAAVIRVSGFTLPSFLSSKPRFRAKPLLTAHEKTLFFKLIPICRERQLTICPQVAMNAILRPQHTLSRDAYYRAFSAAGWKIFDFVLMDQNHMPRLIIELDDHSHDDLFSRAKDRKRDAYAQSAGIPTLRLRKANSLTAIEISRLVDSILFPTR